MLFELGIDKRFYRNYILAINISQFSMNKKIIFVLLLFMFPLVLEAQNKNEKMNKIDKKDSIEIKIRPKSKHNIYGGYGIATIPDIGNIFGNAFARGLTLGSTDLKNQSSQGCFLIGYNYNFTNDIATGIKLSYQKFHGEYHSSGGQISSVKDSYYSIIGGFQINYSNTGYTQLYSGLNLGLFIWDKWSINDNIIKESDSKYLGYQITVLGIRTGGMVGGFLSLVLVIQVFYQEGFRFSSKFIISLIFIKKQKPVENFLNGLFVYKLLSSVFL